MGAFGGGTFGLEPLDWLRFYCMPPGPFSDLGYELCLVFFEEGRTRLRDGGLLPDLPWRVCSPLL